MCRPLHSRGKMTCKDVWQYTVVIDQALVLNTFNRISLTTITLASALR